MKKVNPFWHMLMMGVQLGSVLGGLYSIIALLANADWRYVDWGNFLVISLFIFVLGALIGWFAGTMLGFLDGVFLWFMSYNPQNPFAVLEKKRAIQTGIAILTTAGGFLILYAMVLGDIPAFYSSFGIFALLPPFIAGAAAVCASHRYFVQISPYDKQTEKRKNDDWQ